MKDRQRPECPRTEDLSALVDEELVGAARAEIATHAESCPLCGAMLQDLGGLRAALQPLAGARPGIDLAPLIEQRLRTVGGGSPRPPARSRNGWHGWRLLPQGFVAAGMFATGLYFGGLLAGGPPRHRCNLRQWRCSTRSRRAGCAWGCRPVIRWDNDHGSRDVRTGPFADAQRRNDRRGRLFGGPAREVAGHFPQR
ncbi:MAG: putative transrane transcriptional regulator (anti-sigma factor) [Burkholderiales bacterium]|nr:putative transrane transcriptional regulator (anti-sigma factor) [Burkholderiales bacterium]